ncbi:MAG: fumarate hydratase [Candidatus Aminicenantes bacterium]|nr:fumarate hydratase [Candidatus Aminicenantes bacterium]
MPEFVYQEMFPEGEDTTEYRFLTKDHVSSGLFEGREIVKIGPDGLAYLAEQAFRDVAFLLRPSHLKELQRILDDPEASDNDKYVALELLQNAIISAEGVFPQYQDTRTAVIIGKKGQAVRTGRGDC